ncbi:transglycosylase SLT domain-containing protein [bacterium]|nr:transglycosylase SLT domain-containing protein [bacterium]
MKYTIYIKLLILLFLSVCETQALPLSEDSARFADYWGFVESGDTLAANGFLLETSTKHGERSVQLANFLLAWRAYKAEDDASVPIFLDFGVPQELADHAAWMRASALERAGQTELAANHWLDLARSPETVYRSDAIYRLAEIARASGNLDSLFILVSDYGRISTDIPATQRLETMISEILSELKRHSEAVDRLWSVYLSGPQTTEGKQAKYLLDRYRTNHSFIPRKQTVPEFELELDKLDRSSGFSYGLTRVREKLSDPEWKSCEDMLLFYEGRFLSGIRHNRDALEVLTKHAERYPASPYRDRCLYHLARCAYLRDKDDIAISTIEQLKDEFPGTGAAADGLSLLGLLHLDRGRPEQAAASYQRWYQTRIGTKDESEALWRVGRAYWQAADYTNAASAFLLLAGFGERSDYYPVALYWASRACSINGDSTRADSLVNTLLSRFPYSYYSTLTRCSLPPDSELLPQNLETLALDQLWNSGSVHARKLALLNVLRIPELALREWNEANREMGSESGLYWWKAQLHLWAGNRLEAWRVIRNGLSRYITASGERPFDFYRIVYPLDYDPKIIHLANQYNLDPYFLFALICQESHYEEKVVSGAGAIGLMQLMPATAKQQAKEIGRPFKEGDLYQAEHNLEIGIAHVAKLFEEFSGDSVLVLAAYNAGRSAAQAWFEEFGDLDRDEFIENIPYRETRLFIKNIIEHAAAYRRLYPDVIKTQQSKGTE